MRVLCNQKCVFNVAFSVSPVVRTVFPVAIRTYYYLWSLSLKYIQTLKDNHVKVKYFKRNFVKLNFEENSKNVLAYKITFLSIYTLYIGLSYYQLAFRF